MDNREKQAAYKTRMREKGYVLIAEWVPADQREKLKQFAKELREGRPATDGTPDLTISPSTLAPCYAVRVVPETKTPQVAKVVVERDGTLGGFNNDAVRAMMRADSEKADRERQELLSGPNPPPPTCAPVTSPAEDTEYSEYPVFLESRIHPWRGPPRR
jgi:hypothetical protein